MPASLCGALLASAVLQGSAFGFLITFDGDAVGQLPVGHKYINNPGEGTEIKVIDTSSGSPFAAKNLRSLLLTDTSPTNQPIISYKEATDYASGMASLDFFLYNQTGVFTTSSLTIRVGDGGSSGNISSAPYVAAQVRLSTVKVGANYVGKIEVSNTAGNLVTLDQTFTLNLAYSLEINFTSGVAGGNGSFNLFLTDGQGARVALTSGGGTISTFDYRGATQPGLINTVWLQGGDSTNISSQVAVDNIQLIPEPSSLLFLGLSGAAFLLLRKR